MNLSKSEAGKLGAIANQKVIIEKMRLNRDRYFKSPSLCKHCSNVLPYEKRKAKFCSHSCSATFINNTRGHYRKIPTIKLTNKEKNLKRFNDGLITTRKTIKNCLIELYGHKCMICSSTHWMNSIIPLEVDHIDGNASNNFPVNLRIICPNCHAQTSTSKGRNRGKGRKSLGLPHY